MATTKMLYAAIRKTEGREWIDWSTLRLFVSSARIAAEQLDHSIGKYWVKDNPVVCIAKIQLTETE